MGLLDLYAAQAGPSESPAVTMPSTPGERFSAEVGAAMAPDRYFRIGSSRWDWHQKVIDELHAATGQTFANPYGPTTPEEIGRLGNQPAVEAERRQKLVEANRALRQTNPDAIDAENIDRYIGLEGDRAREHAAALTDTGGGFAAFAGAMLAPTPENILGLMIPPSRALLGASAVGKGFLYGVGREAAFQGAAMAGLTAATEGLDALSRRETGTAPTLSEAAGHVAMAAAGGAVLGGAFHALHTAPRALWERWQGLPEKVRADAPLEVKDAFRLIEADTLYSGQNRLGVDPMLHERYQGRATDAVMRGRPVDLADLTRTADTPLTAVGRALDAPEGVRGLEGLGNAMDRVRALPDREIEAFAREVAPRPFEKLDKVEADLAAVRGKLADLENRAPAIHDLLDPDTSLRLQDVERDLSAPALSRKQRTSLEQERDMILQSVDPADRLPQQAEKARRAERAALEKDAAKLEAAHADAQAGAEAATHDLRRKLDRYAYAPGFEWAGPAEQKMGPALIMAKDLGFKEPADLRTAIARADTLRQARMVRETMPEGPAPNFKPAGETTSAPKEISPEQTKALDTEAARIVETNPGRQVSVDGKTMSAKQALEDADRMAKDASAALNCAVGAL